MSLSFGFVDPMILWILDTWTKIQIVFTACPQNIYGSSYVVSWSWSFSTGMIDHERLELNKKTKKNNKKLPILFYLVHVTKNLIFLYYQ